MKYNGKILGKILNKLKKPCSLTAVSKYMNRSEFHLDIRAFLLQLAGDASDGATSASSSHQHVYFSYREQNTNKWLQH